MFFNLLTAAFVVEHKVITISTSMWGHEVYEINSSLDYLSKCIHFGPHFCLSLQLSILNFDERFAVINATTDKTNTSYDEGCCS